MFQIDLCPSSRYFQDILSLSIFRVDSRTTLTAADSYEMVKALYDFKATFAKTLSFREGEYFILLQRNVKQKNWWQVVNRGGRLGYIPSNYITSVKVCENVPRIRTNIVLLINPTGAAPVPD